MRTAAMLVWIHTPVLLKLFQLKSQVTEWHNTQPLGHDKLQGPGILFESTQTPLISQINTYESIVGGEHASVSKFS